MPAHQSNSQLETFSSSAAGSRKTRPFTLLSVLFIAAVIVLLISNRKFMSTADDVSFPMQLNNFNSMGEYLFHRYTTWSGRLSIDSLLPLVLDSNIWLWRLLNSLMFGGLLLFSMTINNLTGICSRPQERLYLLWGLFFLFFLTKTDVIVWGAFWATGSLNYLWPMSLFLIAILPFIRLLQQTGNSTFLWIASLACGTYAGYQEQTSLLLISFTAFTQIIVYLRTGVFSWWAVVLTCLFGVNFYILITAPGNAIRFTSEAHTYYPAFITMPLFCKAILGYNYTLHNHLFYEAVKQYMFIPCLTFFIAMRTPTPIGVRLTSLYALVFTFICILCARIVGGDCAQFMNLDIYGTVAESSRLNLGDLNFGVLVCSVAAFCAMPITWFYLFKDFNFKITLQLFYFGALLSSLALAASPTIYASGLRVFFIPDMLLIITALLLLNVALNDLLQIKRSYLLIILLLLITTTTANILTIYNRLVA